MTPRHDSSCMRWKSILCIGSIPRHNLHLWPCHLCHAAADLLSLWDHDARYSTSFKDRRGGVWSYTKQWKHEHDDVPNETTVFFCWKIQVSLSQDKTTHYRVFTVMYCQFAILDIAIILPHYIYFSKFLAHNVLNLPGFKENRGFRTFWWIF